MPRRSEGQTIDGWTLVELLGKGGNAEVWRAHCGGEDVALKILNQRRPESEAYQRFRNEIEALKRVGPHDHILPLLDSHLPASPSKMNPAWLAMPIARPLNECLTQSDLREVVTAVAEIARTLTQLQEQFHIHHRDIKPSNLYLFGSHAAISDFGLVDLPQHSELTGAGRPLGPHHFLAYEMLDDPANADPGPADVYSLAKTLWVLAADQRWPPQGEQQASSTHYSIGNHRPHPLAGHLDGLIERCTRHDPVSRPPMREVVDDLEAWLRLDMQTAPEALDLSEKWRELREVAELRLQEARADKEQKQCFRRAVRRLQELLEPLNAEIRRQFPAADMNQREQLVGTFLYDGSSHDTTNEDIRASVLSGPGWNPIRLIIGTAVRTKSDGEAEFGGMFFLGRTETLGGVVDYSTFGPRRAPCESMSLEAGLSELSRELHTQFPSWLERFVDSLKTEME